MVFMALWALEQRVECMDGVVTPETVTTTRSPAVLKRQKISGRKDLCQNGRGQRNLFSPPKKRTKGRQSLTFWNLTGKTLIRMLSFVILHNILHAQCISSTWPHRSSWCQVRELLCHSWGLRRLQGALCKCCKACNVCQSGDGSWPSYVPNGRLKSHRHWHRF